MHTLLRLLVLSALIAVAALASMSPALACACCSDRGSRVDARAKLDEPTRGQIEQMVFAKDATLADDPSGDKGPLPASSSSSYDLTMTRDKGVMTFAFRDPSGRTGMLRFAVPDQIWVFAVDPFGDTKDEGLGPSLYKEWRLTAPVKGDGIFRHSTPPRQMATLIFHGRGRGCTEADHFTDWSLLLHGPAGKATFFGALEKPSRT